ncbi:hypothetical protein MN608_09413 [Microdochium nivale]|nr:hypothetical protein MN608_09413 [Microdochium nivale]
MTVHSPALPLALPPSLSAAVDTTNRPRRARGRFQCSHCGRVFTRGEHCTRHERSHTHEKPFACRYCYKTYARKDLVTRHERTLHQDSQHRTFPTTKGLSTAEYTDNVPLPMHEQQQQQHENQDISPTLLGAMCPQAPHRVLLPPDGLETLDGHSGILPSQHPGQHGEDHCHQRHENDMVISHDHPFDYTTPPVFDPNELDFSDFLEGASDMPFDMAMPDEDTQTTPIETSLLDACMQFPAAAVEQGSLESAVATLKQTVGSVTEESRPNSLARFTEEATPKTRVFKLTERLYSLVRQSLVDQTPATGKQMAAPSHKACDAFLNSYYDCFHCHLPVIHPSTVRSGTAPVPLILAMLCIGSLHRLDRRRARHFYEAAVHLIKKKSSSLAGMSPLWLAQAKLLTTFYGVLSGSHDLVFQAMNDQGVFVLIYHETRLRVLSQPRDMAEATWQSWTEFESWKRLLGGLYVLSVISAVIFDVCPGFNATRDLDFEEFHDEALWNATTAGEWRELLPRSRRSDYRSICEIVMDVISDNGTDAVDTSPYNTSAFSGFIVMHAVVLHMQQLLGVAQSFCRSSSNSGGSDSFSSSLQRIGLRSLARCQQLLTSSEEAEPDVPTAQMQASLLFSCQAVLRMAHIRLFRAAVDFDRLALISPEPTAVEASVAKFASAKLERGPLLLTAVAKFLEGFNISVRAGYMLVRKTAALHCSVQHAVSGWECALLVTKWLHTVEMATLTCDGPDPEETELVSLIKDLLDEADYDFSESRSLASGLARTWSSFLQDVWVWGITPRMGMILQELATEYERLLENAL